MYESSAWREYCQTHGITHEFTAPYLSAQNGLAERAIRTTIDDVRTLLRDSNLGHSYWAEAAAYSIDTCNLIPSRRHPGCIPTESFTGKRQSVAHLRVFGAKCWAKIPAAHGSSKLDPHSTECRLLGYGSGCGNYKVQDITSQHVFVSRDVVFEEGQPHSTSACVGEQQLQIPLFDTNLDIPPLANADVPATNVPDQLATPDFVVDPAVDQVVDHIDRRVNILEPRRSAQAPHPSQARLQSTEYQRRETTGKDEGQEWANDSRR